MGRPTPDGESFHSVVATLVTGRDAMAAAAAPARESIVRLLSHLSTMQRLLDDVTEGGAAATGLTAHRASSRRLRRRLQFFARTNVSGRRGRRLHAGILRETLAQELNAHIEVERELLASLEDVLGPGDVRAFADRYERLMAEAVADPRWAGTFGPGHARRPGQAARLRAARILSRRRANTDESGLGDNRGD